MASHYHPHHHCHPPTPITCCYYCSSTTTSHHPPPPEPLIIHCQSIHPTPPPPQTQYYYSTQIPHNKHKPQTHPRHHQYQDQEEQEQLNPIVTSLLRRISALESSIRHRSSAISLRDAAARTIQTHFRAFLVHRSRTLRQLKELAHIKSSLNTLKSTHSNTTHSDSRALYHKATILLHKLNSLQGDDPMIRDGKRSVNRDLTRFMDYLDELSVKRYQLSSRVVKGVRVNGSSSKSRVSKGDEREMLEKLMKRVEKIEGFSRVSEEEDEDDDDVELQNPRNDQVNGKSGVLKIRNGVLVKRDSGVKPKAKKHVTFAENGNVYMVCRRNNGPVSVTKCDSFDGSDSVEDEEEMAREIEEIGNGHNEEEVHTEDDESPQNSDDDRGARRNVVADSDNELSLNDPIEKEDGSFVFSAPLPLKMEPRPDLMNKKTVKRAN